MREYSFIIAEGINRGIRPHKYVPRGSSFLLDAYNVKIGAAGCQPITPLSTDIANQDPIGPKTPQLFALRSGLYFATTRGVYQVSHDLSVGAQVVESTHDNRSNNSWSVADFGLYQVWCDGFVLYTYRVDEPYQAFAYSTIHNTTIYVPGSEHYAKAKPYFRYVENYNGRLMLSLDLYIFDDGGGFGYPTIEPYWLPLNIVFWSKAGAADRTTDIKRMIDLFLGNADEMWLAGASGCGYIVLSWGGSPVTIKKIGKHIAVYGRPTFGTSRLSDGEYQRRSGGVDILTQYDSPYPTFGTTNIHKVAVAYGRPVAGDDRRHVFIDSDGVLWSLDDSLKKERLGYEELFVPLLQEYTQHAYISHDPTTDDYYITIGRNGGFLLSKNGLSRIRQSIISIADYTKLNPETYSLVDKTVQAIDRSIITDQSAYIVTDTFDMGIRGIKTITGLEIGSSGGSSLSAAVDYRYKNSSQFVSGVFKPVSKNGTVTPMVSGVDFRIRVKSSSYVDFDIDYINVRWKAVDKRLIRGVYGLEGSKAVS